MIIGYYASSIAGADVLPIGALTRSPVHAQVLRTWRSTSKKGRH